VRFLALSRCLIYYTIKQTVRLSVSYDLAKVIVVVMMPSLAKKKNLFFARAPEINIVNDNYL